MANKGAYAYWARLVKQIRGRLGLTQMEFADLLVTKQTNVSRWESGATIPKKSLQARLETLANELDIDSLHGVLAVIHASPFPMILTDQSGFVVGASVCSGFKEGLSVIEQTPSGEREHFRQFKTHLDNSHFWTAGGSRADYTFGSGNHTFKAVCVSVIL